MKHLPTLAFLMVLICLCSWSVRKEQAPNKPAGLIFTAEAEKWIYRADYNFIDIAVTLFNPTQDTVHVANMLCSHDEYFLVDTAAYSIFPDLCEKNWPVVVSIPPGDKMVWGVILTPKNIEVAKSVQPKIGMYLQLPAEYIDNIDALDNLYEARKSAPVIWSNPVDVSKLKRIPY